MSFLPFVYDDATKRVIKIPAGETLPGAVLDLSGPAAALAAEVTAREAAVAAEATARGVVATALAAETAAREAADTATNAALAETQATVTGLAAVTAVRGSVATFADLPAAPKAGDSWIVRRDETHEDRSSLFTAVAGETPWTYLGDFAVDLAPYSKKTELAAAVQGLEAADEGLSEALDEETEAREALAEDVDDLETALAAEVTAREAAVAAEATARGIVATALAAEVTARETLAARTLRPLWDDMSAWGRPAMPPGYTDWPYDADHRTQRYMKAGRLWDNYQIAADYYEDYDRFYFGSLNIIVTPEDNSRVVAIPKMYLHFYDFTDPAVAPYAYDIIDDVRTPPKQDMASDSGFSFYGGVGPYSLDPAETRRCVLFTLPPILVKAGWRFQATIAISRREGTGFMVSEVNRILNKVKAG